MSQLEFGADYALSPVGAQFLIEECDYSPRNYILNLRDDENVMSPRALRVAYRIAVLDLLEGDDIHQGRGRAFFYGELLGLGVAEEFVPHDAVRAIRVGLYNERARRVVTNNPDRTQQLQVHSANTLLETADAGWALAEPSYQEFFDSWDSLIIGEPSHRPFIRRGFGLIMHIMNEVWDAAVEEQFQMEMSVININEAIDSLRQN